MTREGEYLACLLAGDYENARLLAIGPPGMTFGNEPALTLVQRCLWTARARWWLAQG